MKHLVRLAIGLILLGLSVLFGRVLAYTAMGYVLRWIETAAAC